MALAQMPVSVLWFHVPLWVCDLENSDSRLSALNSVSEWRQGSSWGLPAPCCWQALGQIPGPGCGGDCQPHVCKELVQMHPTPPSPSPVGGCQDSALQRWPLRGLVCVPAAPFMCVAQLCAESLTVAPRSRAHPMLPPGAWRPASHPRWPQRLKRLDNEGHDGTRAKSMEALEARVEVWGFHPQEKTSI